MSAATSAAGPGLEFRAGAPDPLAISVVLSPQHSVVALLRQAARGQSRGAPAGLLTAIRDGLRPKARLAAQSFSGLGWIPESSAPIPPLTDTPVADHAARMRDMPAAALSDELHAVGSSSSHFSPPHKRECLPYFRAAADQPRRWLDSMADASLDAWAVAEPRWRAAGPLLDREIRRIATAAVRGGTTALLNSLHPRISYRDGTFAFESWHDDVILCPVGARRLALLPMIAGPDAPLIGFESPDVCYIGYPIRQPSAGPHATPGSTLAMVLGPVRAAILRALRQPLTVSDLAAAVHCAPTTATYHLHQLAAADLITREKTGTSVRVSRTARGHELVDLLSD